MERDQQLEPFYRFISNTLLGAEQLIGIGLFISLAPTNEQAFYGCLAIGATNLVKLGVDARAKRKHDYPTTDDHRLTQAGKVIDYLPPTAPFTQFAEKANKYNHQAYPQVKSDNSAVFRKPFHR